MDCAYMYSFIRVEQLHREIEDIESIYSDLRGLKHDMRNHLNNILNYVNRHSDVKTKEIDGYIGQIEEAVNRLDISSKSGNAITDIIIYQRQQEAKNEYMEKITLDKETGLPYTNKRNKKIHGIGIENIRKCAEKYMGDIDIELYSDGGRKFFFVDCNVM